MRFIFLTNRIYKSMYIFKDCLPRFAYQSTLVMNSYMIMINRSTMLIVLANIEYSIKNICYIMTDNVMMLQ